MKVVIKNNSGEFFNGDCFGPIQAAAEYDRNDLPCIDGLELWDDGDTMDAKYYPEDEPDCLDAEAGIELA